MKLAIRLFAIAGILLSAFAAFAGSPTLPTDPSPRLTILIGGQSNAGGWGQPYTFWGATEPYYDTWIAPGSRVENIAWCYYKDGHWGTVADPMGGGFSSYPRFNLQKPGASVWPMVARELLPVIGNVAFIPCDKGGIGLWYWLYDPPDPATPRLIDDMKSRVRDSGQTPALTVWWHGESDAATSTPRETYKAQLQQIGAELGTAFGTDLMPCKFEHCYDPEAPGQAEINAAIGEAWGTGNIVQGPDLSDINALPGNTVHIVEPAKRRECAHRWATAILAWWAARSTPPARRSQATSSYAMDA